MKFEEAFKLFQSGVLRNAPGASQQSGIGHSCDAHAMWEGGWQSQAAQVGLPQSGCSESVL